jgi:hypothetical protein
LLAKYIKLEMFFRILHRFFVRNKCLPFFQEISVLTDFVDVGFCSHKKKLPIPVFGIGSLKQRPPLHQAVRPACD